MSYNHCKADADKSRSEYSLLNTRGSTSREIFVSLKSTIIVTYQNHSFILLISLILLGEKARQKDGLYHNLQ